MSEHTWTPTDHPGYTELHIDGRVRGYVEHATCLAFWDYTPSSTTGTRSFGVIAPRGTFTTVPAAKDGLLEYVNALDAVCDGRRGIQGKHDGCSPAVCKPLRKV